jgi:hypothetical protein
MGIRVFAIIHNYLSKLDKNAKIVSNRESFTFITTCEEKIRKEMRERAPE